MASSYTVLGTEKMVTGENAGNWGTKTNTNLEILEQSFGGYLAKSIAGGVQTTTLAITDGDSTASTSEARHHVIKLTGTITGNQTVTVPADVVKSYIVSNATSGAYTVLFKAASASGFTFAATNKGTQLLFADGTNIVDTGIGSVATYDLDGGELTLDADSDTSITASTDDQIDFEIAGADDFTMTANAFNVLTGSHATFADSANAKFGTGNDMLVYHDGSNSYVTNATGALKLATETSGIALTIGHTTSETTIADNLTTTGDTSVGGTLGVTGVATFATHVALGDSDILKLGAGTDLTLYHDGSNSYVTNATGALKLATETSGIAITLGHSTSEVTVADNLTVTGTLTGTLATAAQGSVTSLGTLTTLTVDNIITNGATIGHTSDIDLLTLADGALTVAGTIGSGAITSTGIVTGTAFTAGSAVLAEAELELLDGLTAGTAIASKVVTTDSSIDTTGQRNLTISGELDAATLDISSSIDIAGASQFSGAVTVGVDDTGLDVKLFGASAGAYMEWDESIDTLRIVGASADATTSTGKLLLATSLTDINASDVIGKIDFQAPLEAGGTDAITVAASIQAMAQGTFSASVNATDLLFFTGHSEAATEKFRFTSQGEIGVGGANYGTDGQVLTSGGAGAAPAWEDTGAAAVTAVNNATANELVTIGATTTELEAEANLTFDGTDVLVGGAGKLQLRDTGLYIHSSTDGQLDLIADTEIQIAATTIDINGAVALNGAITGATDITLSGELDAATLDISGNADIDGTTNLDAVDIDGAVQIDAAFTSGVDGQGYDTKFFGDTSSAYMLWDTSADDLVFAGAAGIDLAGDIDVDGTANLDVVDIDGAVDMASTLAVAGVSSFAVAANVAQVALTSSSNAVAWDASAAANAYHLTTENTTISAPSNAVEGAFICLELNHDGTTTVAWNAIFNFAADTAPTTTDTNAKTDILVFRYNGAIWQEVGRTLNIPES